MRLWSVTLLLQIHSDNGYPISTVTQYPFYHQYSDNFFTDDRHKSSISTQLNINPLDLFGFKLLDPLWQHLFSIMCVNNLSMLSQLLSLLISPISSIDWELIAACKCYRHLYLFSNVFHRWTAAGAPIFSSVDP